MIRSKNHPTGNGNMPHRRRYHSIFGMAVAVMTLIANMVSSPFASAALDPIAIRETASGSGVYEFYLNNGTTNPSFRPQGFTYYKLVTMSNPSDPLYNWWDYTQYDDAAYGDLFYPGEYDDTETRAELQLMADAGYNTVRFFVNHYAHTGVTANIPAGAPKLYDAYICNLVEGLKAAQDKGMHVILGFGFIPATYEIMMPSAGVDAPRFLKPNGDEEGIIDQHNFNAYYLYPAAVQAMADFTTMVLHYAKDRAGDQGYTNLFNTVMAIDLFNESFFWTDRPPFSLTTMTVTFSHLNPSNYDMSDDGDRLALMNKAYQYWLETVTDAIIEVDSGAFANILRTASVQTPYLQHKEDYSYIDAFVPQVPARVKNMMPTASQIDYIDFHLYPTHRDGSDSYRYIIDDDLATAEIVKAGPRKSKFTDDTALNKPLFMGEYGAAFNSSGTAHYPTLSKAIDCLVMQQHLSFDYGFSGWLLWTWKDPRRENDDGYWNAKVDGSGAIKNLFGQYADPGQRKMFLLRCDSGRNVMWVDDKGNMVLRAGRRVGAYEEGAKPFRVKNSNDYHVLETDLSLDTDWDLLMPGGSNNVHTHNPCYTPTYPLILLKNSSAANVFTLDDDGVINIAGDFYDIDSN